MTIEHSNISYGEIHSVANWVVTSGGVAALGSITVGDGDIGKVAWVAGAGHYVLAGTSPVLWESLGVTITELAYDMPTAMLSIQLSDGTTHSVEIIAGLSESEVNTLISTALSSYDDSIKTYISTAIGNLTTEDVPSSADKRYVTDAQLVVLANTSGANSGDETQSSIKLKLGAASSGVDGYLTGSDWNTFNAKQAALSDVITAGAYGSSTQWPIVTVNAKGIVTGITLQTVPLPTFTDATFSVQKNGSPAIAASWNLTALTASRVHTYPDKAIDFKTLDSIGSSDSNVLSGTRTRVIGGSSNTVSGTDNTFVNCTGTISNGTNNTAIGLYYTNITDANKPFPQGTISLGSSLNPNAILTTDGFHGGALGGITCLHTKTKLVGASNITIDGNDTASSTNCIQAVSSASGQGAATHTIEYIIAVGTDNGFGGLVVRRHVYAKRKVFVNRDQSGSMTSATITQDTDQTLGDAATGTVTVGVTVDTVNNRLVPTVTGTSGTNQTYFQASVRVSSHYNRK